MKNLFRLTFSFLALSALLFTSCEDNGTTPPVDQLPPDVFVSGPSGDIQPSAIVELTIEGDKTDNDLQSIQIQENGIRMSAARFLTYQVNGADETAQDVFALNAFPDGFTLIVTFEAPAGVGNYDYTGVLTDVNGKTSEHTFTLRIQSAPAILSLTNPPSEISTGQTFFVEIDAVKGDAVMSFLSVFEDGLLVDPVRLTWDGASLTDNPVSLTVDQEDTFAGTLGIVGPNADGFYSYTIQVEDLTGTTTETGFDVTVNAGTPIDAELTTTLLSNQAGPAGFGALDLDDGLQAGVTTDGATTKEQTEIRDLGLDCTMSPGTFNWRRQIGSINGSELRKVDLSAVENFTFDNTATKEQIIGAFETGFVLNDGESVNCSNGNTTAVTNVSDEVFEDELFVVKNSAGTRYYLIEIVKINENNTGNDDYYEINVKY